MKTWQVSLDDLPGGLPVHHFLLLKAHPLCTNICVLGIVGIPPCIPRLRGNLK